MKRKDLSVFKRFPDSNQGDFFFTFHRFKDGRREPHAFLWTPDNGSSEIQLTDGEKSELLELEASTLDPRSAYFTAMKGLMRSSLASVDGLRRCVHALICEDVETNDANSHVEAAFQHLLSAVSELAMDRDDLLPRDLEVFSDS